MAENTQPPPRKPGLLRLGLLILIPLLVWNFWIVWPNPLPLLLLILVLGWLGWPTVAGQVGPLPLGKGKAHSSENNPPAGDVAGIAAAEELPNRVGRERILRSTTRALHLAPGVNLNILAKTTAGFSRAELENLSNQALQIAARKEHRQILMVDFEEALDRMLLGSSHTLLLGDHERKVLAYHVAGHALIAWLTNGAEPVQKLSILSAGKGLHPTAALPAGDHHLYTQDDLLARLAVLLGGRAAEEVGLNEITTGAGDDLVVATILARRMVSRWGMGGLGLMALPAESGSFLSQAQSAAERSQENDVSQVTSSRIDQGIQRLLLECYENDLRLLAVHRHKLDSLVHTLLQDETIDQEVLFRILGARNPAAQVEVDTPQALSSAS